MIRLDTYDRTVDFHLYLYNIQLPLLCFFFKVPNMELHGQDLTNLPLGLSLPRAKLPVFSYQQEHQKPLMPPQPNTTQHSYLPQTQPFHAMHGQQPQYQQQHYVMSDDDSGCDLMDDSLTDMQWLQRMDASTLYKTSLPFKLPLSSIGRKMNLCIYIPHFYLLFLYTVHVYNKPLHTHTQTHTHCFTAGVPGMTKGGRKRATGRGADKENKKSGKDGSCRKKLDYSTGKKSTSSNKPPLSYASLIALAICSTPQRMMTLSGIYRWIENTFPFYRTPEAKAWKVGICIVSE